MSKLWIVPIFVCVLLLGQLFRDNADCAARISGLEMKINEQQKEIDQLTKSLSPMLDADKAITDLEAVGKDLDLTKERLEKALPKQRPAGEILKDYLPPADKPKPSDKPQEPPKEKPRKSHLKQAIWTQSLA